MLFNFDVQANPGGAPLLCLQWKELWEQKGEDGNSKSKNKRGNTCSSSTMCWGYWPLCMILCAASFTSNCWKHITLYAIQCGVEALPKARWTRGLSAVSKVTSSTNKLSLQSCQAVQKQLANFCQAVCCHQAIAIGFLKRQHLNWTLSNFINKFFIKHLKKKICGFLNKKTYQIPCLGKQ